MEQIKPFINDEDAQETICLRKLMNRTIEHENLLEKNLKVLRQIRSRIEEEFPKRMEALNEKIRENLRRGRQSMLMYSAQQFKKDLMDLSEEQNKLILEEEELQHDDFEMHFTLKVS